MSWKLRNAGWNRGMKRYQKKGGGYGYYDPNSDGVEYIILGFILLIVGIFSIPLDVMPLPPILIIGGIVLMSNKLFSPKIELSERTKNLILHEKLVDESKGKNKLKKMPKSMVKEKIIEWANTKEIKPYWKETRSARYLGDTSFLCYQDNDLFLKWNIWKMKQGYESDAEE